MPSLNPLLLAGLALSLVTGAVYEARLLSQRNHRLEILRARETSLDAQSARANREKEEAAREFAAAQADLTSLQALENSDSVRHERSEAAVIQAWMGRLQRLKELFSERPEQSIPELSLLKDAAFLNLARSAAFDTEEHIRAALAAARTAAKFRFALPLGSALRKYTAAHGGAPPASVLELAAYYTGDYTPAMFDRYEIKAGPPNEKGATPILTERRAVDEDYDTRVQIQPRDGFSILSAPYAWVPGFFDQSAAAAAAYRENHAGASAPGIRELLPYFNPPLSSSAAERLIQAEHDYRQR